MGTLDDVVLAYGLAHLTTVRDGRTLAVIDELLVAEPARAVGLGEAVLAALVAWAADHGALGVDATALPGDRTAKNFFEVRRLHRPPARHAHQPEPNETT